MSETVEIPKELLRRVMAEVEELRTAAAEHGAEADALREEVTALRAQIAAGGSATHTAAADDARRAAETARHDAERDRDAARADIDRTRRDAEAGRLAAARDLASATEARDDAERARREMERTHPLPPTRVPAEPTDAAGVEPAEALRRGYVAWCRRGSPLVSRAYLFAAFLREAAPGLPVAVRPVFRDRTAAGIAFSDNPVGVEYWLAVVGPVAAVLPQPSSPYAFTELGPVYGGALTPDRLGRIDLALADDRGHAVAADGGGTFSVALRGTVSPD